MEYENRYRKLDQVLGKYCRPYFRVWGIETQWIYIMKTKYDEFQFLLIIFTTVSYKYHDPIDPRGRVGMQRLAVLG